jgi:hypothetical protein
VPKEASAGKQKCTKGAEIAADALN